MVGKRKREKKLDNGEVQLKNIDKPSMLEFMWKNLCKSIVQIRIPTTGCWR